jgi:uncharacterized repeat protein (TIGR03803 family)
VFGLFHSGNLWKEKVLYSFGTIKGDIEFPFGSLTMDAAGNLYGTAENGGASQSYCGGSGCGGVFKLTHSGTQWNETVIYNFTGTQDGGLPLANVIFDAAGNLYGTTDFSETSGAGVVFELSPSTGGSWTETTLYNFTGGADGGTPESGLTFDSAGNLYGTTYMGGNALCNSTGCGTVFKLTPQGGNWALSTVFAFDGSNGGWPSAGVVFDSAGNLYGTVTGFGKNGQGGVFKLSPHGGIWIEDFASFDLTDGGIPAGQLILNNGFLYGTAEHGGTGQLPGNGVVFKIHL